MGNRRRILLVLVFCFVILGLAVHSFAATIVEEGTCGPNLTWSYRDDGLLLISGSGEMYNFTADTVPWKKYIDSMVSVQVQEGVTSIGDYAFSGFGIRNASLPSTITRIGNNAFRNCAGVTISTPVEGLISLQAIGDNAFSGCTNLTSFSFREGLRTIGNGAFAGSGIMAVSFPKTVTSIGNRAFENCPALWRIRMRGSVENVGARAFAGCTAMQQMHFYYGAPTIGENAFEGIEATLHYPQNDATWSESVRKDYGGTITYKSYISPEYTSGDCGVEEDTVFWSLREDGTLIISGNGPMIDYLSQDSNGIVIYWSRYYDMIKKVVVEEGVTHIGAHALYGAPNLISVEIADSVESIGMRAFSKCPKLTTVSFGSGLKKTSIELFSHCDSLTKITLPNYDVEYGNDLFLGCSNLTDVVIPGALNRIGEGMFAECVKLEQIVIPEGVKEIGGKAFYGTALKKIQFPNSLEIIDCFAFRNCQGLVSVQVPGNVISINEGAFSLCENLTSLTLSEGTRKLGPRLIELSNLVRSVTIPSTVTVLENAFSSAFGLESVKFMGNYPKCTGNVFGYITITAYYPSNNPSWAEEFLRDYAGTVTWVGYESTLSMPTVVDGGAYNDQINWMVTNDYTLIITGTGTVDIFSDYPWDEWYSRIRHIIVEEGITGLGTDIFYDFEYVKDVVLPTSLEFINRAAFRGCISLEEIRIPAAVTYIGYDAFSLCNGLKRVYFEGSAPEIDRNAFDEATMTAYYPPNDESWTEDVRKNYGGTITWLTADHVHAYTTTVVPPTCVEPGYTDHTCVCGDSFRDGYTMVTEHQWGDDSAIVKTCKVCGKTTGYRIHMYLPIEEQADSVWIDGEEYPVVNTGNSFYVDVAHKNATNLVIYSYNDPTAEDIHTQYPTGMKVWILEFLNEDSGYRATYIKEFDDLLQYSGSSIRIAGVKGIRMITSITNANKQALTGGGLAGYKLVEYGTALAWASDLADGNSLVLGAPYAKSNYAYKRGVADPVFKKTGTLVQYTNVLVGFTDDQCIPDIAMRPYIILEDSTGRQVTIYGGMLYRSIGYIAYQNRNAFKPGSDAYAYVWKIIRHVYGAKYDSEFKG